MSRDQENAEVRWAWAKMYIEPNIKEAANDQSAEGLLPNHEFLIRSYAKAQCVVKCRKTAHSWGIALDALARAATEPRSTSIIISYDEEEAKSKNRFVEWIYGVLPAHVKAELRMSDGQDERRFANGSIIKFSTRKAPTGAGATVYVDEFSVEGKSGISSAEILVGAIGATTHGGYIRIGGTEREPETLFHKIVTGQWKEAVDGEGDLGADDLPEVEWQIGKFPWWESPALCKDIATARTEAPLLPTVERVRKFGNDKLKIQYVTYTKTPLLGEVMFQREFEMEALDPSESYFPADLVRACIAPATPRYWFARDIVNGKDLTPAQQKGENGIEQAQSVIRRVQSATRSREIESELGAALDIARDSDLAVIAIGGIPAAKRTLIRLRALILMHKVPFPALRRIWYEVLDTLPVMRGCADATKGSVGRQLGEEAFQKYAHRSLQFEFTPSNQLTAIAALKGRMENGGLELPPESRDGDIEKEFLAIKRKETGLTGMSFLVPRTATGHCDIFMTLAMLGTLFDQPNAPSVEVLTIPRIPPSIGAHLPGYHAPRALPSGGARQAASHLAQRFRQPRY